MNGVTFLRLQGAKEALRILENTPQTSYQHDIYIDEAIGTYDVDCSGFVSVFVVAEQPVAVDADIMAVMAYDASDILRHDDSRGPGPDQFQTGVGSGTFHLYVTAAGTPSAFQFGPGDPIVTDNIAIGRIELFDD